jgi:hypothetical protein
MVPMKVTDKIGHVGAGLSFACLVHCLAFPVLVTLLPAIGLGFLLTGTAEKIILGCAVGLCAAGLLSGYRKHRDIKPFALLLAAPMYYWMAMSTRHHLLYILLGGISLAWASLMNRSLSRKCEQGCGCDPVASDSCEFSKRAA